MAKLEKDQHRVQEEQEWVRQEQATLAAYLEQVLAHFGQEVQKVEELQKNTLVAAAAAVTTASAHLVMAPQSVTSVSGSHASTKINKPQCYPISLEWILFQRMRDPMNNGDSKLRELKRCAQRRLFHLPLFVLFEEKLEK